MYYIIYMDGNVYQVVHSMWWVKNLINHRKKTRPNAVFTFEKVEK